MTGKNFTTKSTSLTDTTKSKPFTAKEICDILREVRGLADITVQCRDLLIEYRPQGPGDAEYQRQITGTVQNPASEIPKEWKEQASLADERALIEAEEAQLQIESPFDYEQAQIDYHADKAKGKY